MLGGSRRVATAIQQRMQMVCTHKIRAVGYQEPDHTLHHRVNVRTPEMVAWHVVQQPFEVVRGRNCWELLLPSFTPARRVLIGAGLVTGITVATVGVGEPPLALIYQHQLAAVMRSTLAVCFLIGELLSLGIPWVTGRTEWQDVLGSLQLVPALMTGALIGKFAHVHLHPGGLRLFVVAFSITSGAVLLFSA